MGKAAMGPWASFVTRLRSHWAAMLRRFLSTTLGHLLRWRACWDGWAYVDSGACAGLDALGH